jgi:hypothetical protein
MTNKYEIISAVHWNDIGVPRSKTSGWSKEVECMAEGETSHLVKKGTIYIELFRFLPYSLHGANIASTFVFQPQTCPFRLYEDLHNT